ncbi:MAG: HAMP domain-containing histidine kinase, partial [Lachnospiraceae bacterium]|nr:HAMP domain-containing histidine kinase [Lachnospiraceae bacterium]
YQIDTERMFKGDKKTAESVNQMGDTITGAVERSMADERMKTELITNVSHDIKTPLTSVINYVDLLKREDIKNERVREYIRILEEKSQRLKVLIFDLVEASKISSGNITLQNSRLDMRELISQSLGEFEDRFEDSGLSVMYQKPEQSMCVWADPARMWRVLENLLGNVSKYAMPGSRVYIQLEQGPADKVNLTIKNMSKNPLNISEQELMERFVRGDEARSTEGSGLGLSIARDLIRLMNGDLLVQLDGDLFKVSILMQVMEQKTDPAVIPKQAGEETESTASQAGKEAFPEEAASAVETESEADEASDTKEETDTEK